MLRDKNVPPIVGMRDKNVPPIGCGVSGLEAGSEIGRCPYFTEIGRCPYLNRGNMRCPYCYYLESKVVDSRIIEGGSTIRRRRECSQCNKRFTTYEKVREVPLLIAKKDGRREAFDRDKVLAGILKACQKRPISMEVMDKLVDQIERNCRASPEKEVESKKIGKEVMEGLRRLDPVAYVRFASVYKEFTDVGKFAQELKNLKGRERR